MVNTGSLENDTVERKKFLRADTKRRGFCFVFLRLCEVEMYEIHRKVMESNLKGKTFESIMKNCFNSYGKFTVPIFF